MFFSIGKIVEDTGKAWRGFLGVVGGVDDGGSVHALKTTVAGELVIEEVAATTPSLYRVDIAAINTQYSQVLPAGARAFTMQPRQNRTVRFAFVTGKVAGPVEPYATMKNGAPYTSPKLLLTAATTVYVAAGIPNTDVEIIVWS